MKKFGKRVREILAPIAFLLFMIILAGTDLVGVIPLVISGLFCLTYWVKYAIRVVGFFRKQNQNAWPKWLGLWTTVNILWVIASFQWELLGPTAMSIFVGPIVGSFILIISMPVSLLEYGHEAYRDLVGRDELPYLLLALVFSTTTSGLVIVLNSGRLRQSAACVILIAVSVGAALGLAPQPEFIMH